MLDRLFSTHNQHRTYAVVIAISLAVYLVAGFALVKWLFLGQVVLPTLVTGALILAATGLFASVHIASMKQLDRVSRRPRD
jgi:hypothetical protein